MRVQRSNLTKQLSDCQKQPQLPFLAERDSWWNRLHYRNKMEHLKKSTDNQYINNKQHHKTHPKTQVVLLLEQNGTLSSPAKGRRQSSLLAKEGPREVEHATTRTLLANQTIKTLCINT